MAAQLEEITAQFAGERPNCRWGDVFVGQIRLSNGSAVNGQRLAGLKGEATEGELVVGLEYRFYGRWSEYKNQRTGSVEKQFLFTTYTQSEPHEREGIIAYLVQAGQGRGIGPARASMIYDRWGSECVAKLRESPEEVVLAIRGLSIEDAQEAATWLKSRQKLEACTIAVTGLLTGRGFRKNTPRWAICAFGNLAAEVIHRDPFRLIQAPGVGFKRCDALWSHLKLPANRLRRQAMCAWYSVAEERDGSTWVPMDMAKEGVKKLIGGADIQPDKAIEMCVRLGTINPGRKGALTTIRSDFDGSTIQSDGCRQWIAVAAKAMAEKALAELIVQASTEKSIRSATFRLIDRYPGYKFSSDGQVYSCWTNGGKQSEGWKLLLSEEIKGGYLRVRLRVDTQVYEACQVAHLILEAFVGKRPLDYVACHRDGDPKNNSISNLRWDTRPNNEEDKKLAGTHQTGSGNPAAKLTEDDAIKIRELYEFTEVSTYKLADMFNVSRRTIGQIVNRENWTHI